MLRRGDDWDATYGAAKQLLIVVKDGDDFALSGRVRLKQFDVERGEA